MVKHAETDCIVMHCRLDLRISQGLLEQVLAMDPSQKDILVSDWCDASAGFILGSAEKKQIYDMMKCIEVFTWKLSSPVTHNAICATFMSDTFRYIQILYLFLSEDAKGVVLATGPPATRDWSWIPLPTPNWRFGPPLRVRAKTPRLHSSWLFQRLQRLSWNRMGDST